MDDALLSRINKTILLSGAFLFPFLAQKLAPSILFGMVLGALLSLLNLHLLRSIFQIIFGKNLPLTDEGKPGFLQRSRRLALHPLRRFPSVVLLMKFPFVYGLIFVLVYGLHLSPYAIMLGFSFPLMAIVLKAVGQATVGID